MPRTSRHKIDVHVGGFVRQRRLACGLSQSTLAENLGITYQQIQKYETGKNRICASRLFEIAMALNCPVECFFNGLPETDNSRPSASGTFAPEHVTAQQWQCARLLARLDKKTLNHIAGLLRALSDSAAQDA